MLAIAKTHQNDDDEKMTLGCVKKQIIKLMITFVMMMKKN